MLLIIGVCLCDVCTLLFISVLVPEFHQDNMSV